MDQSEIFCIDGLNMRIKQNMKVESLFKWLNLIFTPQTDFCLG